MYNKYLNDMRKSRNTTQITMFTNKINFMLNSIYTLVCKERKSCTKKARLPGSILSPLQSYHAVTMCNRPSSLHIRFFSPDILKKVYTLALSFKHQELAIKCLCLIIINIELLSLSMPISKHFDIQLTAICISLLSYLHWKFTS